MKYYVAYGSNLNREQMAHRCPDAKLVGTGMLSNYEMVFRGNKSNAVATVEPKKGMEVPVGIWEISEMMSISLIAMKVIHTSTKRKI